MTRSQIITIHVAAQQLKLIEKDTASGTATDQGYRNLLHNVAGVASAKDLDNTTFEDVMAVMEDMGFRYDGHPDTYFRDKVAQRGTYANARMVFKIRELARGVPYVLQGLVRQQSSGRTDDPEKLTPKEAHNLIEALKEIHERLDERTRAGAPEPEPAQLQEVTDEPPF